MIVNGEQLSVEILEEKSLNSLLNYFKLSQTRVAVEINGTIIKKTDYNQTNLNENDHIEIIHFVGGGS